MTTETAGSVRGRIAARRYRPDDRDEWDAFVRRSRNGTFLFERGYMDYHAARFTDHSLVVRDDTAAVVALLPASRDEDVVISHGGLTYGGFLVDERMTLPVMGEVFGSAAAELRRAGVARLRYKTIPAIYHTVPTDEDQYWLFRAGARLYRRDVLTVIRHPGRLAPQERRRRAVAKARGAGLHVAESDDWAGFWSVLDENLRTRYGVAPVHSCDELTLLAGRFPDAIRLYAAYAGHEMLAGAVVYVTRTVCHVQYNAATPSGKRLGALDLVLEHMLQACAARLPYFDFGASTERDGHLLNRGLVEYKEGFGGRTVVHDMYEWDLRIGDATP